MVVYRLSTKRRFGDGLVPCLGDCIQPTSPSADCFLKNKKNRYNRFEEKWAFDMGRCLPMSCLIYDMDKKFFVKELGTSFTSHGVVLWVSEYRTSWFNLESHPANQ